MLLDAYVPLWGANHNSPVVCPSVLTESRESLKEIS
jgi:hypothetical protein